MLELGSEANEMAVAPNVAIPGAARAAVLSWAHRVFKPWVKDNQEHEEHGWYGWRIKSTLKLGVHIATVEEYEEIQAYAVKMLSQEQSERVSVSKITPALTEAPSKPQIPESTIAQEQPVKGSRRPIEPPPIIPMTPEQHSKHLRITPDWRLKASPHIGALYGLIHREEWPEQTKALAMIEQGAIGQRKVPVFVWLPLVLLAASLLLFMVFRGNENLSEFAKKQGRCSSYGL